LIDTKKLGALIVTRQQSVKDSAYPIQFDPGGLTDLLSAASIPAYIGPSSACMRLYPVALHRLSFA
jgi:hypothetical protein